MTILLSRPKLNGQQQAVVEWVRNGRGSLNLVARAGCGKTYTLIQGAVRTIVEENLGEVALMAFNKSAADEFKDRLERMAKETRDRRFLEWKRVQAGTCHSFGFSAVRRWAKDVKVNDKKVAGICQALALEARQRRPNHSDWTPVYEAETSAILKLVSLAKQSAFGFLTPITDEGAWYDLALHHAVDEELEGDTPMGDVVDAAILVLKRSIALDREVVDFDDMILAPLVHNLRIWPRDWVLIDEAQDTNAARRALALKMLKPRTGRLIAVGDPRQAIYGFTGADADAMDLIAAELRSATLPLTITYRCPKAVVREANRLVPDLQAHESAPEGVVRYLPAARAEDESQVQWFEDERPGAEDAVLCRNTKHLVETAYAMLAKGIGCRVEGREIGEGLVKLATRWKRTKRLVALEEKLVEYRDKEVQKWQAKGREDRCQAVEDKVEALLSISRALVAEGKDEVEALVAWIKALFGDTCPGERQNVVTLSTIHKAKGREWDRVYLLFRNATLPSPYARKPWQMNQEENLEYVAITRAKRELVYVD